MLRVSSSTSRTSDRFVSCPKKSMLASYIMSEVSIDQVDGLVEPHKKQNAGVVVVLDSVIDDMRRFRSYSKITQDITIYIRVRDVAVQSSLCVSDVFEVQTWKQRTKGSKNPQEAKKGFDTVECIEHFWKTYIPVAKYILLLQRQPSCNF